MNMSRNLAYAECAMVSQSQGELHVKWTELKWSEVHAWKPDNRAVGLCSTGSGGSRSGSRATLSNCIGPWRRHICFAMNLSLSLLLFSSIHQLCNAHKWIEINNNILLCQCHGQSTEPKTGRSIVKCVPHYIRYLCLSLPLLIVLQCDLLLHSLLLFNSR